MTGEYDRAEVNLLTSFMTPGSTAVDIGASLGLYTVQLARYAARIKGRVVAIEPVPDNGDVIERNLAGNDLEGVTTLHRIAAGRSAGTLTMKIERGGMGNASVADGVSAEEMDRHSAPGGLDTEIAVPVATLDSLEIPSGVSVVKIDVEGFEMDVLAGAEEFVEHNRPVIFAEFNPQWMRSRGLTGAEPFSWAAEHRYRVMAVRPLRRSRVLQHRDLSTEPVDSPQERGDAELLLVPEEWDAARPRVLTVGAAGDPVCGVRDQAAVLDAGLAHRLESGRRLWFEMDPGWGPIRRGVELIRWFWDFDEAVRAGRPRWILWHYAPGTHGHRNLPVFAPLWARRLTRWDTPLVVMLHEFAYPFGVRGWRGNAQALTQRLALIAIMRRCAGAVVTTEDRRRWLTSRRWLPKTPVTTVPVCSNLPAALPAAGPAGSAGSAGSAQPPERVGVFGFRRELSGPDPLVPALARLRQGGRPVELVLVGAPGPNSPQAGEWLDAARRAGCEGMIRLTGVLPPDELARVLAEIPLFVFTETDGPNTAKSTLGALLALGRPVVALRGVRQDPLMVAAEAVELSENDPDDLAGVLQGLLDSEERRRELGARAAAFYDRHMSCDVAARLISEFAHDLAGES